MLQKKPPVPFHNFSIFEVLDYFSQLFLSPKVLPSFSPPLAKIMKTGLCCRFLEPILLLMLLSSCAASTRPFTTLDEPPQQEKMLHFPQSAFDSKRGTMMMYGHGGVTDRGLSRLGSRPPSCQHRCEGCSPCDAIQIPANTDRKGLLYANYEPEGWKCKCGTAFFNP